MVPRGCCYVLLLDLPLHLIQQLIGAMVFGGVVVLPPCPMAAAVVRPAVTISFLRWRCRWAALACPSTQQPIDEGQCQYNSRRWSRRDGGGVVPSDVCVHIVVPFFSRGWVKRRLSCTIPYRCRCRPSHDRSCRGNSGCAGRRGVMYPSSSKTVALGIDAVVQQGQHRPTGPGWILGMAARIAPPIRAQSPPGPIPA